jgi:hypothetical protein
MKFTRIKPSYIIYNKQTNNTNAKQTIAICNTLHITINCQNFVVYCFKDDGVISSILGFHALSTFHHKCLFYKIKLGLGLGHGFGGCKEKKNEHQGDYYIW